MNVIGECRKSRLGLWSCPPFLFIVMGLINVAAMISSYLLASRYVEEPEAAALVVIAVALAVFLIGNSIIHGFTQIVEADRMKGEFVAIVSHQLRSPLSIFKWSLDAMAEKAAGPSGSGGISHLEILRENAEKMIQLVNVLLEVSRIESGRAAFRREPVRMDELTKEVIRSSAPYARASSVSFDFAAPTGLAAARGDSEKIKMVIQNLVDNAVRYSRRAGRVSIGISAAGAMIEWRISDTGVGIPRDQQKFIFQKFFRLPSPLDRQTDGSGLGLYIARSIITALGGEIGFSSAEDKGSTFWFRLPAYEQAA